MYALAAEPLACGAQASASIRAARLHHRRREPTGRLRNRPRSPGAGSRMVAPAMPASTTTRHLTVADVLACRTLVVITVTFLATLETSLSAGSPRHSSLFLSGFGHEHMPRGQRCLSTPASAVSTRARCGDPRVHWRSTGPMSSRPYGSRSRGPSIRVRLDTNRRLPMGIGKQGAADH